MSSAQLTSACEGTREPEFGLALACYVEALRNAAHYAIELDERLTPTYQKYLSRLAGEVEGGEPEALTESRATLRALLRDYRDRAAEYLARLRDELAGSARALQEILESLAQTNEDHEQRLRGALGQLRVLSQSAEGEALRKAIAAAASAIESSLDDIRKQHQVTVAQFHAEIHMLHKRIDALEAAAAIDDLTKLFRRGEMEERLRARSSEPYCLLLLRTEGIRQAAVSFNQAVSAELAGGFIRRLKNLLPDEPVIARWSEEEFVALLEAPPGEVSARARLAGEQLAGQYACLYEGKTVRPTLRLKIGVVDSGDDPPDRVLERVAEFLG